MATEAEILTKLNDLLDGIAAVLDGAGASKLVTLDRDTGADAALVYLRENGDEKFRWGMPGGEDDFVIQRSPDGSALTYEDVFRIDAETGAITITGLALDGASFADATFTGQALFADGSAAAPSIANDGDTNTGLFFPAADQAGVAVAGSEIARFTPVGLGVNTSSPRQALDVVGKVLSSTSKTNAAAKQGLFGTTHYDTSEEPFFGVHCYTSAASNTLYLGGGTSSGNAATAIVFATAADTTTVTGTEVMRIDSAGRVCIGGSSGAYPLDVYGDIRARNAFKVGTGAGTAYGDDNLIKPASPSAFLNIKGGAGHAKILLGNDDVNISSGTGSIVFRYGAGVTDGGVEAMRIDSLGRVGVGTSSPGSEFEIMDKAGDNDVRMNMRMTDGSLTQWGASSGATFIDSLGARPFILFINSTERLRVDASGNLLIGTSTPGASKLVVNDDSIQINTAKTPASASATGTTGQIAWDASFVYVCTATDTWKRAALATW